MLTSAANRIDRCLLNLKICFDLKLLVLFDLELESCFDFDLELASRFDFESEVDDDDDDSCCVCFRQLFRGTRVRSKGLDVRVNVFFSLLDGDRGMLDVFRSDRVKVRDAFLSILGGDFDFLEDADFDFEFDFAAGEDDGDRDGNEGNLDADILNERERANVRGVVVGVSGLSGSCSDADAVAADVAADVKLVDDDSSVRHDASTTSGKVRLIEDSKVSHPMLAFLM